MDYQVCWKAENGSHWEAQFFYLRESAREYYKIMRSLYKEVKILKIGANK